MVPPVVLQGIYISIPRGCKRTTIAKVVWLTDCLQLFWQYTTVLSVCHCLDRLQFSWQFATVLTSHGLCRIGPYFLWGWVPRSRNTSCYKVILMDGLEEEALRAPVDSIKLRYGCALANEGAYERQFIKHTIVSELFSERVALNRPLQTPLHKHKLELKLSIIPRTKLYCIVISRSW